MPVLGDACELVSADISPRFLLASVESVVVMRTLSHACELVSAVTARENSHDAFQSAPARSVLVAIDGLVSGPSS